MSRTDHGVEPGAGGAALLLLSDSRALYEGQTLRPYLRPEGSGAATAVYVGASSADQPEFYAIFLAAMKERGFESGGMITSDYHPVDRDRLGAAHLIVLGGGDPDLGRRVMQGTGLWEDLRRRYAEGATLLGVSAGAIQLGMKCPADQPAGAPNWEEGLALAPYVVDVHDEASDWNRLGSVVRASDPPVPGIGIGFGGAVAALADGTVVPLRGSVVELRVRDDELVRHLLLPMESEER